MMRTLLCILFLVSILYDRGLADSGYDFSTRKPAWYVKPTWKTPSAYKLKLAFFFPYRMKRWESYNHIRNLKEADIIEPIVSAMSRPVDIRIYRYAIFDKSYSCKHENYVKTTPLTRFITRRDYNYNIDWLWYIMKDCAVYYMGSPNKAKLEYTLFIAFHDDIPAYDAKYRKVLSTDRVPSQMYGKDMIYEFEKVMKVGALFVVSNEYHNKWLNFAHKLQIRGRGVITFSKDLPKHLAEEVVAITSVDNPHDQYVQNTNYYVNHMLRKHFVYKGKFDSENPIIFVFVLPRASGRKMHSLIKYFDDERVYPTMLSAVERAFPSARFAVCAYNSLKTEYVSSIIETKPVLEITENTFKNFQLQYHQIEEATPRPHTRILSINNCIRTLVTGGKVEPQYSKYNPWSGFWPLGNGYAEWLHKKEMWKRSRYDQYRGQYVVVSFGHEQFLSLPDNCSSAGLKCSETQFIKEVMLDIVMSRPMHIHNVLETDKDHMVEASYQPVRQLLTETVPMSTQVIFDSDSNAFSVAEAMMEAGMNLMKTFVTDSPRYALKKKIESSVWPENLREKKALNIFLQTPRKLDLSFLKAIGEVYQRSYRELYDFATRMKLQLLIGIGQYGSVPLPDEEDKRTCQVIDPLSPSLGFNDRRRFDLIQFGEKDSDDPYQQLYDCFVATSAIYATRALGDPKSTLNIVPILVSSIPTRSCTYMKSPDKKETDDSKIYRTLTEMYHKGYYVVFFAPREVYSKWLADYYLPAPLYELNPDVGFNNQLLTAILKVAQDLEFSKNKYNEKYNVRPKRRTRREI